MKAIIVVKAKKDYCKIDLPRRALIPQLQPTPLVDTTEIVPQ